MSNNLMRKYVKFICGELPREVNVILDIPKYSNVTKIGKLNLSPRIRTEINVIEMYSRSAKIKVKFDGIESDKIFYFSSQKGPERTLNEFHKNVEKLVNKILIDEEHNGLIKEKYKKSEERKEIFYSKLGEVINNAKINE